MLQPRARQRDVKVRVGQFLPIVSAAHPRIPIDLDHSLLHHRDHDLRISFLIIPSLLGYLLKTASFSEPSGETRGRNNLIQRCLYFAIH